MREEEKKTSQVKKLQQFFRKRWVFPAIYLVSAAVILTAVLWYQSVSNDEVKDQLADNGGNSAYDNNDDAVEVGKSMENVAMPVVDSENVSEKKKTNCRSNVARHFRTRDGGSISQKYCKGSRIVIRCAAPLFLYTG